MATSAVAGYKALLLASTASGQTAAQLAELKDYNIDVSHAEIDVTNHDSSGTREIIAGIDQWTGGGEINYVTSSSGANHAALYDVLVNKVQVDFEFLPTGSSSDGYFSGTGYVSGFNMTAPTEDALNASLTFAGNGAFARSASSST
jgi:TP901-1 family phage major tail protein